MKKSIAQLREYFTCDDDVVRQKYFDLLDSFWHLDQGLILKYFDVNESEITLTFINQNNQDENLVIPLLPQVMPLTFISGLVDIIATKVDKVPGKGLSSNDFTQELKTKLELLENYIHPDEHQVSEINGLQAILNDKVSIEFGKDLSTNDYTDADKAKLNEIEATSQVEFKTVYVDIVSGDDNTGVIENPNKPFLSLDAAIAAIPDWDGNDTWKIKLISSGVYEVFQVLPRRNLIIESNQTITIDMKHDSNVMSTASGTDVAKMYFNLPFGTYQHISTSATAFFHTHRIFLCLIFDKIILDNSITTNAYFNLSYEPYTYGCQIKVNRVETNMPFFYGRKFSTDNTNVIIDVEIGHVTTTGSSEFSFFTEDYRYDLIKSSIIIHSFKSESTSYINIFELSSVSKKNIYIGDVVGSVNSVFIFSIVKDAHISFLSSNLYNTFFARSWTSWAPGYRIMTGTILNYIGTSGSVIQSTSYSGSYVHFKNLFIKNFVSNNANSWIFDLTQNSDARGEWLFDNCHFISNCRTLRNGGSSDRIKMIGINIFKDVGDTTNFSVDKYLPNTGQFIIQNEGTLKTNSVRDTNNSDGDPCIVIESNLNTY